MKKAFIFPGQGSQFSGMASDIYAESSDARSLLDRADAILGFKITDIMFNGTSEELKATKVTQPAVFLHSVVLALCHPELVSIKPDMVAGHSLGEFSALTAAGAMDFEDALKLVSIRANAMQKCCEAVSGSMAAIIGLDEKAVEGICEACAGTVVAANYNSDIQIVISGENHAIEEACAKAKEAGAKRVLPLPVSGAFHSPLMEQAREELAFAIDATVIKKPICAVYQNVSGTAISDPDTIKRNLLTQLTSPVRWTQSVRNMLEDGADFFVEVGPGNVLQGLVKRISTGAEVNVKGISKLIDSINN